MTLSHIFVAAVLATSALAAPTAGHAAIPKVKSHFSVGVKPHRHVKHPEKALAHAYQKFGWDTTKAHNLALADPAADPSSSSDLFVEEATNLINGLLKLNLGNELHPASSPELAASSAAASTTLAPYGSVPTPPPYQNSTAFATATASRALSTAASSTTATAVTGEVTATPEQPNDAEYLSPVTIGGQELTLDFDTGSSDLWVFSTALPADAIGQHTAFDPSKSTTFENYTGSSWAIHYGDGSYASGTAGFDTVSIGGATVAHQCVELATALSGSFETDTESDGLLGLGFSIINQVRPQKQQTWFENLMPSLAEPLFTVDLAKDAAGTYEFGAIDPAKYVGDIEYTPVNNSVGFWAFDSTYYAVGSGADNLTVAHCDTCNFVIADTGSSLMILDDDIVSAYYAQVPGAVQRNGYGWIYDCATPLPTFAFQLGDSHTLAHISGDEMTYADLANGKCMGGLQSNGNQPPQVLGDMFLKNFFVVFDGGNLQLGVARKN